GPVVAVLLESSRPRLARELLGAAARLARPVGGSVVALNTMPTLDDATASSWGADAIVRLSGSAVEEDVAGALIAWCESAPPWAVLAPGTMWGRDVASRVAARLGAGLTGDAVDLDVRDGRLVGWKPAFGGRLVAAVIATSPVQMATVRPGMLPVPEPREPSDVPVEEIVVRAGGRVHYLDAMREDDVDTLQIARAVVGVGTGVTPDAYPELDPLLAVLGAEMGATRKVTDKGWLPRARQIGITGRSISPLLYVAIGLSGKFNHVVGVRGAGQILAVNRDPDALVFQSADVGIVGDWHEVVPRLVAELLAQRTTERVEA
ncbi:MAG: electron transfer flavoprotein beta subunit, partial [Acidimicrobiales bacterium]|nr:electron transfer flavoprotein beta subunit [Acidimicrobiales bacterium]